MKKLFLAAVAAMLVPFSSSAATFKIDVTGNLDFALVWGVSGYNSDGEPIRLGLVHIDDPSSSFYWPSRFSEGRHGSARITEEHAGPYRYRASNCTGILRQLCWGDFDFDMTTGRAASYDGNGNSVLQFGPFRSGSVGSFGFAWDVGNQPNIGGYYDGPTYADPRAPFPGPMFGDLIEMGDYSGNTFFDANGSVFANYGLTSYTISAVPVPAALPLLAAGVAGLGFIGRRKKKAA